MTWNMDFSFSVTNRISYSYTDKLSFWRKPIANGESWNGWGLPQESEPFYRSWGWPDKWPYSWKVNILYILSYTLNYHKNKITRANILLQYIDMLRSSVAQEWLLRGTYHCAELKKKWSKLYSIFILADGPLDINIKIIEY